MEISTFFYIIFSSIQIGLIYALISIGFNLLYSSTKIINVAYGDFITIGAFVAYWLFVLYDVPPPLSIFVAIVILAFVSVPLYQILFKRLLASKSIEYIEVWGVIITFGLSILLQGIMALIWSAQAKGYSYLDDVVEIFSLTFTMNKIVTVLISATLVSVLYYMLFKTDTGISMRSVIQDPNLAETIGLEMNRIFLLAFVLSSIIAGIAGVLLSMSFEINPFMGTTYIILAFVVTAIGGVGNPIGSFIGGLLLGALSVLIGYTIGPGLNLFIIYTLLVAVLIIRPKGLMGRSA
jgi:branched-chain amino acid transport system permease protein